MSEDILFALRITVIAMTVVFGALVLVSFVVVLFQKISKLFIKQASTPQTGEKIVEKYPQELPPELIAVISIAVACAIDKKFQIKKLRYRSAVPESSWSKQGVASIMASHAISKHKSEYHRV